MTDELCIFVGLLFLSLHIFISILIKKLLYAVFNWSGYLDIG